MSMAFLATLFLSLQLISNKEFGRRFPTRLAGGALLNAVALSMASAVAALLGGMKPLLGSAMMLAVAFGSVFAMTVLLILKSFETGPLGTSSLIINSSLLISIIGGILIWGEELTLEKGIGILMILLLLSMAAAGDGYKGQSQRNWLLFCLGAFGGNGILSLIQKAVTWLHPDVSSIQFNGWAYSFAALLCSTVVLIMWLHGDKLEEYRANKRLFLCCALGQGTGSMAGAIFMLMALSELPTIVVYPITQGGQVILLWFAGIVIYQDKIRFYDVIKLLVGLTGILFLCGTIHLSI